MAQATDFIIDNDTGANVRADLNAVLNAILTTNSGTARPSGAVKGTMWFHTQENSLYIFDGSVDIKIAKHGEIPTKASTQIAQAGIDDSSFMTALAVAKHIEANPPSPSTDASLLTGDINAAVLPSFGEIGAPALCKNITSSHISPGSVVSGSSLRYSDAQGFLSGTNVLPGSWKAFGWCGALKVGLFVREA